MVAWDMPPNAWPIWDALNNWPSSERTCAIAQFGRKETPA